MFASTCVVALLMSLVSNVAAHGQMSRYLVINDLSIVAVMADAETTEGPFDEDVEDYTYDSDLTAAAVAGSPGVSVDRASVLDAVPLTLAINVYDLSTADEGYANEYPNVDVFLWHTDANGVYSSVEQARQSKEGTDGQHWCRSYQTTDSNGLVTFQTIMPGWYTGRVIHFHVRLRAKDSSNWAATSQFFVSDSDLNSYEDMSPYSSNTASQTSLSSDNIYRNLDSDVAELLTLDLSGSAASGFSATMNLGLICDDCDEVVSSPTDAPVASPTDAPVASPTDAPVVPPTDAPVTSPTDAPVVPPTDAPVTSPTDAPVVPPTDAPVTTPTDAPVVSPTDAPVVPPTDAPVASPTDDSPTPAPVVTKRPRRGAAGRNNKRNKKNAKVRARN